MIKINKFKITERMECSTDTKLFFDDVYKSSTRGKKQQVDVLQYGRSMIEMLGVLAIVGVLSVGGIAGYSKAMMQFKINKTAEQITQIATNIRTLYAQQTTYEGLSGNNAVKMEVIPDSLTTTLVSSSSYSYIDITHAFNGYFGIAGYQDWSAPNPYEAFSIYLEGLPKEACIKLATMDWGSGSSSGLVSVSVNNGGCFSCDDGYVGCQGVNNENTTTACPGGSVLSVPMPITAATTACSGSNPQLTIKFK